MSAAFAPSLPQRSCHGGWLGCNVLQELKAALALRLE